MVTSGGEYSILIILCPIVRARSIIPRTIQSLHLESTLHRRSIPAFVLTVAIFEDQLSGNLGLHISGLI